MKDADERPGNEWFTRKECAGLIGVSQSGFDGHWRPKLGKGDSLKRGKTVWLRGRAVVDLYVARQVGKVVGEEADELLVAGGGGSSPALEKYRIEKAAIARLDRIEREGDIVRKEAVHTALGRLASLIRGAGEILQRQFGTEAQDILDGALDEFEGDVNDTAISDGV